MELASETNDVFTWLTATNRGAEEVCKAALLNKGITKADTDLGYDCDPTSKSTLGILAIMGLYFDLPATSTRVAASSTVHYVS